MSIMFCSAYGAHFFLDPQHNLELVSGIEKASQDKTKEGKVNKEKLNPVDYMRLTS